MARKPRIEYEGAFYHVSISKSDPLFALETLNYSYDANGNRTNMNRSSSFSDLIGESSIKLPNPASNINYNEANQMLSFNNKNIIYDNNGNMTSVTNSCGITTYTWDARNRLVGINGFKPDCTPLTASLQIRRFKSKDREDNKWKDNTVFI